MQPMPYTSSPLSCICIDIHRIIFTLYHSSLLFICIIHLYHSSASHLPRCLSRSVTTSANYLFTCRWCKNRRISNATHWKNEPKKYRRTVGPVPGPRGLTVRGQICVESPSDGKFKMFSIERSLIGTIFNFAHLGLFLFSGKLLRRAFSKLVAKPLKYPVYGISSLDFSSIYALQLFLHRGSNLF